MRQALELALEWIEKQPEETPHSKYDVDTRYVVIREIEAALAQPDQEPTYASTQATNCAGCGEHKHTPLRIDAMGGYVCLTCIDKKLGSLLGEFGYAQPEQEPVAMLERDPSIGRLRVTYEDAVTELDEGVYPLYTKPQGWRDNVAQAYLKGFDEGCKSMLEKNQNEPVAYLTKRKIGGTEGLLRADMVDKSTKNQETHDFIPLYTTPPQRNPLTDEQIYELWTEQGLANSYDIYSLKEHVRRAARAIEAAHGIKE